MTAAVFFAPAPARARARLRAWIDAPTLLLLAYVAYAFIGTHPFADPSVGERVEGSIVDRIAVLAMFGFAVIVGWMHRRATLRVVLRNPGLTFVLAMCLASVVWSDYPDLTLRRSLLFFFLTSCAAVAAASARALARLHVVLFASLTFVMLLNHVSIVATPSIAITPIGVRGLYPQKNVAGYVAMITIVCGAACRPMPAP